MSDYYGWLAKHGQEPVPDTLAICRRCRKTVGDWGGVYGDECRCAERKAGHNAQPGIDNVDQRPTMSDIPQSETP
jgi:hypothetical protein